MGIDQLTTRIIQRRQFSWVFNVFLQFYRSEWMSCVRLHGGHQRWWKSLPSEKGKGEKSIINHHRLWSWHLRLLLNPTQKDFLVISHFKNFKLMVNNGKIIEKFTLRNSYSYTLRLKIQNHSKLLSYLVSVRKFEIFCCWNL